MGLANKMKRLLGADERGREVVLLSPLEGGVVPLEEVADETFATKILGDGVAILPCGETVYAPAAGRVEQTFDSGHALTMITDEGVELLLHVGIDTVRLQGKHFEILVTADQRVEVGAPLLRFEAEMIKREGFDLTTPLIVSNSDSFDVQKVAAGRVAVGTPLLKLMRKGR